MSTQKRKLIKRIVLLPFVSFLLLLVLMFSINGVSQPPAQAYCLKVKPVISGATAIDDLKCYRDAPGPDIYEGDTKKCITGTGNCNAVGCDGLTEGCYTMPRVQN